MTNLDICIKCKHGFIQGTENPKDPWRFINCTLIGKDDPNKGYKFYYTIGTFLQDSRNKDDYALSKKFTRPEACPYELEHVLLSKKKK